MSAKETMRRLLAEAELPIEGDCIGRVFAFTWADEHGAERRVVGRIDGLAITGDGEHHSLLNVVSNSLRKRRDEANTLPIITYRRSKQGWHIYFGDLRPLEQSSPDNPQIYDGVFELL